MTQPTVTAVVAWLVLRERLQGQQIFGILAATFGIVATIARLDFMVLQTLSINFGDAAMLLSVSFYACYAVNLHRWIGQVGPILMMYMTCVGGAVVLLPFYSLEAIWAQATVFSWSVISAILFMAIVPILIATTMWNMSVGVVGPNRRLVGASEKSGRSADFEFMGIIARCLRSELIHRVRPLGD